MFTINLVIVRDLFDRGCVQINRNILDTVSLKNSRYSIRKIILHYVDISCII